MSKTPRNVLIFRLALIALPVLIIGFLLEERHPTIAAWILSTILGAWALVVAYFIVKAFWVLLTGNDDAASADIDGICDLCGSTTKNHRAEFYYGKFAGQGQGFNGAWVKISRYEILGSGFSLICADCAHRRRMKRRIPLTAVVIMGGLLLPYMLPEVIALSQSSGEVNGRFWFYLICTIVVGCMFVFGSIWLLSTWGRGFLDEIAFEQARAGLEQRHGSLTGFTSKQFAGMQKE